MLRSMTVAALLGPVFLIVSAASSYLTIPVSAQIASRTAAQLNDEKLRQMLDGMGLEPKALSQGFVVTVRRDAWTTYVQLVISPDQGKIGLNANLGVVENPDAVTAGQWRALLGANQDIDPSSFYYDVPKKKLFLHCVMDNREVTPAYLRSQIDKFVENLTSTQTLWSFTK